jgi:hypothetical protein
MYPEGYFADSTNADADADADLVSTLCEWSDQKLGTGEVLRISS